MRADARELLEKQRITSGLAEDPVALVRFLDPGEQRLGRNPIERLHVEDNGDAARRSRRGEQTGCRVARSEHQHEQVRTGWRPAEHVVEKLERRLVSPVDVIQDESDGLARAEGVEEVTHRPVKPPAIRRCTPRSPARDFVLRSSGNTVASPPSRSSPSSRSSEAGTSRRAGSRASMTGANGTWAHELRRTAVEDDEPPLHRPLTCDVEQPGPADPGLAAKDDEPALASCHGCGRGRNRLALRVAAEQRIP